MVNGQERQHFVLACRTRWLKTTLGEAHERPPYGGGVAPHVMDLKGAAWMVRSLDQSVSMVHLADSNDVFAGGWDGRLACWDAEGNSLWTAQTPDRISAMALGDDLVIAASGLHLVALDRASGEQRWSVALEGSADDVRWWQGDIIAVSSVYDIEHNDFIESAIWRYTSEGECVWVERMDERPWVVLEQDDTLLAGLGRPRCGYLEIGGTPPFAHVKPPTSSPTTSGSARGSSVLFGQTDGSVVQPDGTVLSTESGSIEHLTCMVKGYVATTDEGHAVGRTDDGEACWESKGAPVSVQMEAMEYEGASLLWVARDEGLGSQLVVWSSNQSTSLASASYGRVRAMHGTGNRAVIGCEDGTVVVWERAMLQRRLQSDTPAVETQDERTSALQAKLRALRQS